MQGSWNGGRAHYRCRYPAEYAIASRTEHPKNAYVREDAIVPPLDAWLAGAFDAEHLDATVEALLAGGEADLHHAQAEAARRKLADCEQRLARYRDALEAGADAQVVARWTKETEEQRRAAEVALRHATTAGRQPSRKDLEALIRGAGDLVGVLATAATEDKTKLDARLGLGLRYEPDRRRVVGRPPGR
ncbi:MAG: zinc ribbon domain-containing protein [Egibacteraceae bacterium]